MDTVLSGFQTLWVLRMVLLFLVISVVSIVKDLIRVVTLGDWKFPTETPTEMRLRPEAAKAGLFLRCINDVQGPISNGPWGPFRLS